MVLRELNTDHAVIKFMSDNVCLVEAKYGVNITRDKARQTYQLIDDGMEGDYAVIVDRVSDHSFAPLQVYEVMNSYPRLKVAALVLHRRSSFMGVALEKRLFSGEMQVFRYVSDAYSWARRRLNVMALQVPRFQHEGEVPD